MNKRQRDANRATDGIDPGWEEVPRREATEEDLAVFQIGKEWL
jgi:hypothetical protein